MQDTPRSSRKGLQSCVNLGDEGGFGSPTRGSFPRRQTKELGQVSKNQVFALIVTNYLRSRSLLGQRTRTLTSGLQIFARGQASGKLNCCLDLRFLLQLPTFRDKLGFRQRAGSLAGFGSKKHQINWDKNLFFFWSKKHQNQPRLENQNLLQLNCCSSSP